MVALLLISRTLSAELLVQLHNSGGCYDCGPPQGTGFSFSTLVPVPFPSTFPRAEWDVFATPADVGKTFNMPAALVPEFNAILTSPLDIYGTMRCCGQGGGGNFYDTHRLNGGVVDILTVDRFAPSRGPNLNGYRVTAITQTVDSLVYEQIDPQTWRGNGTHTVSVYGEPVPAIAGDFNRDSTVNSGDYVVWRDRVGEYGEMPNGSGEGFFEGHAVPGDYAFWRANFGRTAFGAGLATAVPEPATWVLVCVATCVFAGRFRFAKR
jgi:hypothetical protein